MGTESKMAQFTEEQIVEMKEAFSLFDKDGSGNLMTKEIGAVMRSLGQNPTEQDLQDMVNEVDADGNGTVDFMEFLALNAKQNGAAQPTSEDEFMDGMGVRLSAEAIDGMFKQADADGSGSIGFEE